MWQGVLDKAGKAAQRQDWATAEGTLLAAADRKGVPPTVWFQLGKVMFMQRKLPEAQKWFQKAAEAVPNVPDGWFELGRALAADKRFEDAVKALHRALALDPDNGQAHRFACVAARESGDMELAQRHADEMTRLGEPMVG
ncbi:MAG: tetratricopeptide repeat protein [Pseudomonadota bacterium]